MARTRSTAKKSPTKIVSVTKTNNIPRKKAKPASESEKPVPKSPAKSPKAKSPAKAPKPKRAPKRKNAKKVLEETKETAAKKSTRKTAKEPATLPDTAPAATSPKSLPTTAAAPKPALGNEDVRKAEVVFSFDTTGSMYPCLTQVRRKIQECVERLFREIGSENLRIGITAHGDYCDAHTYITKHLPLTTNISTIVNFVENVAATFGGDAPECYELVLHETQNFAWIDGWSHILVLIGDDVPHEKHANPHSLDWREELDKLNSKKIMVHGVQALNRRHASHFYADCARRTGGCHLQLDQFSSIVDLVMAVCYRESANMDRLQQYELEVQREPGRYNRSVRRIFDQMLGRATGASDPPGDLNAVPAGRFQVLDVDKDTSIKDFVLAQGVTFKKGRGFYEFNKPETIQKYKEIIVMDKKTGDMFEGRHARTMLGLPTDTDVKITPSNYDYIFFVQSTSYNRKLIGGTKFLYEVEDY